MMLGLGLGLGGRAGGASYFDPATLSLTGWWRGSFSASPWVGTASAGTSSANDLTEPTNVPAVGSSVNGYAPADFDGTNDLFTADGTATDYYTASAYSGWALVNIDAIGTNDATPYNNDHILAPSADAFHGIALRSTGVVWAWSYDTGSGLFNGPTATFTTSTWQLVQWKHGGGNLKIRVNEGAWDSSARSNLAAGFSNDLIHIGYNPQANKYLNGRVLDLAVASSALSDDDFDDVLSYARGRYGLALT
jgi:hypothetical protein